MVPFRGAGGPCPVAVNSLSLEERKQSNPRLQMASIPDSPVRIRIASSMLDTKIFAVADPPGLGGATDRVDRLFDHVVAEHDLDLHLGEKIDDVFGAAIEFGVTLLAPEPLASVTVMP
jgi:hypothetical protein